MAINTIYKDPVLEKKLYYTSQLYAMSTYFGEYFTSTILLLWGQIAGELGVDSTFLSFFTSISIFVSVLMLVFYTKYAKYPNYTAAVVLSLSACTQQLWVILTPNLRSLLVMSLVILPVWGLLSSTFTYFEGTMLRKVNRANQNVASKWIAFTNYHSVAANLISAGIFYLSFGSDFLAFGYANTNAFVMLNSGIPFGLVWAWLLYKDNDNIIMLIDKAESVKNEDIVAGTDSNSRIRLKRNENMENVNVNVNEENKSLGDNKNRVPHYHVEYILGFADLFRKASNYPLFFLLQYMTETNNTIDVSYYALIAALSVTATAVGSITTMYIQGRDDASLNSINSLLITKNILCLLVWLPYLTEPNTTGLGIAIVGFYLSYSGSFKLIPDLNNRLTYETTRGSNILLLAQFFGTFVTSIVGLIWYLTGYTETFVFANIFCTAMCTVLCTVAKSFSYLQNEDEDDDKERQRLI